MISGKYSNRDQAAQKPINPVTVFCRMRPLPSCDKNSVEIKNETTVALIPQVSMVHPKANAYHETHYVFKQVFAKYSSQADVYNAVGQPLVERLLCGLNSLLFSYGVSASGKTYTMTGDVGDDQHCGIMERCLDKLFRKISGLQVKKHVFLTDHLNGFEISTKVLEKHENLKLCRARISSPLLMPENGVNALQDPTDSNADNVYTVFITYIEVYNNAVYDLLEESVVQKSLQSRIVREDAHHIMYVHGATELEIHSVHEAVEAFHRGQKRKRMGHTALNADSSRSHSVFNIRLVQAPAIKPPQASKRTITISQLSLVDLAGSERLGRTKNTGAKLREACNINNSLLTLRTCLQYLRDNQLGLSGVPTKKIPYRDSKITHLFKHFFEGDGKVCMIVCINPRLEDYAENAQVLRFAEVTQEVQIVHNRPLHSNRANNGLFEKFKLHPSWVSDNREDELKSLIMGEISNIAELKSLLKLLYSKIAYLEKQNTKQFDELENLRKAYKSATGRNWNGMGVKRVQPNSNQTNDPEWSKLQCKRKEILKKQNNHPLTVNSQEKPNSAAELEFKLKRQRDKLKVVEASKNIRAKTCRLSRSFGFVNIKVDVDSGESASPMYLTPIEKKSKTIKAMSTQAARPAIKISTPNQGEYTGHSVAESDYNNFKLQFSDLDECPDSPKSKISAEIENKTPLDVFKNKKVDQARQVNYADTDVQKPLRKPLGEIGHASFSHYDGFCQPIDPKECTPRGDTSCTNSLFQRDREVEKQKQELLKSIKEPDGSPSTIRNQSSENTIDNKCNRRFLNEGSFNSFII